MARYRLSLHDLARAVAALGVPILPDDHAGRYVEVTLEPLEPVEPPTAADVRAERYRGVVTELARKGLSNRAIARELNDRLMLGPRNGLWHSSSIRRLRARIGV